MFDFAFAVLAIAAASSPSSGAPDRAAPQSTTSVIIGENVQIGAATVIEGQVANASGLNEAVIPSGLVAEEQVRTGRFTSALEVKPILEATKANWIGVRDYGGNDLVYVTHLWGWRCGLAAMALSVNDGPLQNMPLPDCHLEYATPNAILEQDGLPYLTYPQGSVAKVTIQLVYDDLTRDIAHFERNQVLIP